MQFTQSLYKNMPLHLLQGRLPVCSCQLADEPIKDYKSPSREHSAQISISRRKLCSSVSLVAALILNQGISALPVNAKDTKATDKEKDDGIVGAITSLFDPNEKTKTGKALPKAYLKSARELVKTLRESLNEDRNDMAKFRRTADSAKESIRDYLNNWRGKESVAKEESYTELEKVIRSLASFYAKAGPSASMTDEVKSEILQDLDAADEFL